MHQVLEHSKAVDIEERERTMKADGFVLPAPVTPIAPAISGAEPIRLVEERMSVGKRQYDRGGVRVRTYVVGHFSQRAGRVAQ